MLKVGIVFFFSLDDLGVISDTNLLAKIKSDGTVEWEPPMLFTVHCEVCTHHSNTPL